MHPVHIVRLSNRDQKQGNIAAYFEHIHNLAQTNDGTRSFSMKTVDCHDQQAPFYHESGTQIEITHKDHHVSNMNDGFLSVKVELTLQLFGIDSQYTDNDHLMEISIDWKSPNQMLDSLQILCNNLDTCYQQNEYTREGFTYSTIKAQREKKTKKSTLSLYENVSEYSSTVWGTYINVSYFKDGLLHTVEFEVSIQLDDLLVFCAFDLFPNEAVGEPTLKFYVNSKGLI